MEETNRHRQEGGTKEGDGPAKGRKPIRHNRPRAEDLGGHLVKIFAGRDATVLPGISGYTWLQLYAETGNDLKKWATEKHYTSWLGLAPGQHSSGKMRKNRNRKYRPKAGQVFRQIAQSLIESKKSHWALLAGG